MTRLQYTTTERDRIDGRLDTVTSDLATLQANIPTPDLLAGATWIDVKLNHGAVGNGIADDRTAITNALAAANTAINAGAGNVVLFFPAGTYLVSRNGANAWCIDIPCDGIIMCGVRGASKIKLQAQVSTASLAIIRSNNRDRLTIRDLLIDGNWGNAVGLSDSDAGLNHANQTGNPQHYGIMIRGTTNVSLENVDVKQVYGDGIWVGTSTTSVASDNVNGHHVNVDMVARHCLTFQNGSTRIRFSKFSFTNCFSGTIDSEPVGTFKAPKDIHLTNGLIGRWWSDAVIRFPLSIIGSDNTASETSAARGYRITDCTVLGNVLISNAYDCVISGCRVICDYSTNSHSPIYIDHTSEDVTVENSYIYDRGGSAGDTHIAAVAVRHYINNYRPSRITLKNLRIHARNGRAGICVDGAGGIRMLTGTANSVTATTLVHTGAGWSTNQASGAIVRIGTKHAAINTNTNDTLTHFGWFDAPFGDASAASPSPGAYVVMGRRGDVVIENCFVDCTDDGYGAGGVGLYLDAGDITAQPGDSVVKVCGLTVRNATADAVKVQSRTGANPWRFLHLEKIQACDDQITPTCTVAVRFVTSPAVNITKLIMRGVSVDGVANYLAGVGTASPNLIKWLVRDGQSQEWEGYGAPSFTATKGSRYWRQDGGASTTLYVNETGTSTWRAV